MEFRHGKTMLEKSEGTGKDDAVKREPWDAEKRSSSEAHRMGEGALLEAVQHDNVPAVCLRANLFSWLP